MLREHNALAGYPEPPAPRIVGDRTIEERIIASYRERDFFDGERRCGYGGLKDDGRWGPIAEGMIREYALSADSRILQIQCELGFLVNEFRKRGMVAWGLDDSEYARRRGGEWVRGDGTATALGNWDPFDLVIAIGPVYTKTLPDAIRTLSEIERVKKPGGHSFITLGAYETPDDFWLLRGWSLLGELLLKKAEWIAVMKHADYSGDYKWVTAQSLNLMWPDDR